MDLRLWRCWLGIPLVVTALLLCGASPGGIPAKSEAGPLPAEGDELVMDFWVEPRVIEPGGCAVLLWRVEGIEARVLLDGQEVEPVGEEQVCPKQTTAYELIAETAGTSHTRELTLYVGEEPGPEEAGQIPVYFQVVEPEAIPRGACARLVWELPPDISEDWPMFVDGEEVDRMGDRLICPEESTVYHLLIETPDGPREYELPLQVVGGPTEQDRAFGGEPIPGEPGMMEFPIEFLAAPDAIPPGECTTLVWQVPEGDWSVLIEGQQVPHSGQAKACPEETRSYELKIEGMGEPRSARVTVHVEGGMPTEPGQPPEPTPPQAQPQPQPTSPQPQPTAPPPQPQPGGKGSDVAVTDLYPQNQPKGKIWARITNHGPEALSNAQVELKCGGTGIDANGQTAWSHVESPKIKTVSLKPGETVAMETDVSIDTDLYSYDLWCAAWPKSFTDPNQNNNKYSEKVAAKQPQVPPGGSSWGATKADLAVTDLFPQNLPKGAVMMRVVNHGPQAIGTVDVETTCTATIHGWTQGSPTSTANQVFKIKAGLNPGQQGEYYTGIDVDTQQHWYDITCSIKPPFNDPNAGNNSYQETIPPPP